MVHAALAQGFGFVMLYGAIGVWGFALASFFTFGRPRATDRAALLCCEHDRC